MINISIINSYQLFHLDITDNTSNTMPILIANTVLDKIPAIYICETVDGDSLKPGRSTKYLATKKLNPVFEALLTSGVPYSVTGKVDGTCCLVRNYKLMKRRDIKPKKKIPVGWVETGKPKAHVKSKSGTVIRTKKPPHRIGFMDVSLDSSDDKWLRTALKVKVRVVYLKTLVKKYGKLFIEWVNIEDLNNISVEMVGPKIQLNTHKLDQQCAIPHGMFVLKGCPKDFDYDILVEWFKTDDHTKYFEGIVVHFKTGEMFKLHRYHLDMEWDGIDLMTIYDPKSVDPIDSKIDNKIDNNIDNNIDNKIDNNIDDLNKTINNSIILNAE